MRIVSGKLGGRKLFSTGGDGTRPTSDRVREALFNILGGRVTNTSVLDLFAGTGALGIESISRGARSAVCIDNRKAAIGTIRKNLQHLDLEEEIKIIMWDIARNLNCLQAPAPIYDLVFMDPPYERGLIQKAIENLHRSQSIRPGATLVVEHSSRERLPQDLDFVDLEDQRKYGKTLVSFLTYMV